MKESAAGPEQISPEELAANRVDNLANARAREMDDDWYRSQSPDWSKVTMTAGGGNSSPYRPIMVASRYPSRPLPFRHAADRNSLSRAKFG